MLTLEPHTPPNSVRFRVCKEHVHQPFLGYKPPGSDPNRGYQWVTYGEFGTMVDSARALLHRSGIGKGDTVRTQCAPGLFCGSGIGKARSRATHG